MHLLLFIVLKVLGPGLDQQFRHDLQKYNDIYIYNYIQTK